MQDFGMQKQRNHVIKIIPSSKDCLITNQTYVFLTKGLCF